MHATASEFTPIEDHGLIGDLATVALVSLDSVIDFMCYPDFDSPTLFASLLDPDGGHFALTPTMDSARRRQIYLPDSNILLTRFLCDSGVAEISDFMPLDGDAPQGRIVRRAKTVMGEVSFRMSCRPRPKYARAVPEVRIEEGRAVFVSDGLKLGLHTPLALEAGEGEASAAFTLRAGESMYFVLCCGEGEPPDIDERYVSRAFKETSNYWRGWLSQSTYTGRWREMVHRSALALKLMTSRKNGSIVAAPTFGLPEEIGGVRNWDYRYTWIRDAAFTLYALMRLGFGHESQDFVTWLLERTEGCAEDGSMQIMYGIDGRRELPERELAHLRGYMDSKPVLVGNAAHDQLQLDIYGELMDAVYLANKHVGMITKDAWRRLRRSVDFVIANWQEPDEGIWEVRGGRKHFLSSRLMCWVALDRAYRTAMKNSLPAPMDEWVRVRNEIHDSIFADFWDEELGCFVQYAGSKDLDASVLLMPLVKFIGHTDPYWLKTMKRIEQELVIDCLVMRYTNHDKGIDGLAGTEGTFTTCAFWFVECLARSGDVKQARFFFEKMLSYANHLGLYGEELAPSGRHLGNFPQALTHLALISAAYALNDEMEKGGG
jgi:GH15 family glucan-1,4-alpha-glucosidase